ncbi:MAG: purine-nucleoside phosphorylase [Syntrophothermus sp.]
MFNFNLKYKDLNKFFDDNSFKPDITIVLGSGLGKFAEKVIILRTFDCKDIPQYPPSTIIGHSGKIHFAEHSGKKLLLFQGRIHFYEGYELYQCLLPIHISKILNSQKVLLTNAAGGISSNLYPGALMLNSSFNGMQIKKELYKVIAPMSIYGINYLRNFPSTDFNDLIRKSAKQKEVDLQEGVYWYTKGPTYETPSEVKMVQKFGGDAVGMSTVHEAMFAAYIGIPTAAISCITNFASGISAQKLSHSEVTETASLVEDKFTSLVKGIIENI